MINTVETSPNTVTITQQKYNASNVQPRSKSDVDVDAAEAAAHTPGKGFDVSIGWDPELHRLSGDRPEKERGHHPNAGLAHELSHAEDYVTGNADLNDKKSKKGVSEGEAKAIRAENRARYRYGNNQRTIWIKGIPVDDPGAWPPTDGTRAFPSDDGTKAKSCEEKKEKP
jgi:hypothetical protein